MVGVWEEDDTKTASTPACPLRGTDELHKLIPKNRKLGTHYAWFTRASDGEASCVTSSI